MKNVNKGSKVFTSSRLPNLEPASRTFKQGTGASRAPCAGAGTLCLDHTLRHLRFSDRPRVTKDRLSAVSPFLIICKPGTNLRGNCCLLRGGVQKAEMDRGGIPGSQSMRPLSILCGLHLYDPTIWKCVK